MTDAELLRLLRENPEQGCACLLEQYTGLVLTVVRRKIGGCCTDEDIEEVTSDILFEFYRKRDQISADKGSIRGLLVKMATLRSLDFYRKLSARPQFQTTDSVADTLADPAATPEEQVLTAERRKQLLTAIQALGEPNTEIIIRKYYKGETAAQIAEHLSMRTGTVEMRLSRARQKLKAMLGGAEHDDR